MSDHCTDCLPDAAELVRLTENVQAGRREAFVGTGDPETVLSCLHGSWRLGDVLNPPRVCTETTKAGDPCKGTPGDDGLCAAHKQKEGASAAGDLPPVVVDGDQAQDGGQGGQAEDGQEGGRQEDGGAEDGD